MGVSGKLLRLALGLAVLTALLAARGAFAREAEYMGAATCGGCHEKEYANYTKYSKKAHSGNSVKIMARKLAADELKECFHCHVTGYGKPGGFVSFEKTPDMANAGCEVCHGPGSAHVEAGGTKSLIKRKLTVQDCEVCHNAERVANFNFKPMIFGGAH